MALDNAQLVEFCNDELRQIGDRLNALDIRTAAAVAEYNARNLGTVINDGGSSGPVIDGSATDGRTVVTGGDVFNLITMVQELQTFFAVAGRRDVIAKWNVNGHRAG
jgi:hypothetical protein